MAASLIQRWRGRLGHSGHALRVDDLPAPALLVGRDGKVIETNMPAGPLRNALESGDAEDLTAAIGVALAGGTGSALTVDINRGAGRFALIVSPLADGTVLVAGWDSALDHNLRAALSESRQRYKDLVEISTDFAWEVGGDGRFVFVSPGGALGWPADQLVGARPETFIVDAIAGKAPPEDFAGPSAALAADENADPDRGENGISPFSARQPLQNAELWFRRADGGVACLNASVRPILAPDGRWAGARGVCRDVSDARQRDAELARAHGRERLFGYIVRAIRDVVEPERTLDAAAQAIDRALAVGVTAIYAFDGRRLRIAAQQGLDAENRTFEGDESAPGQSLVEKALAGGGMVSGERDGGNALAVATRCRGAVNGALFLWREASLGPWTEDEHQLAPALAEHVGIAIEQLARHRQLRELSRTDGLTGLLNRRSFMDDVSRRHDRAMAALRAGSSAPAGALVYCDLDNFKQVNDTHGHDRGDAAIRELAALLVRHTRGTDLVARLGGDEFALWLDEADSRAARSKAETLLAAADCLLPYSGGPESPLGLSLGIAVTETEAGAQPESLEQLMARADAAMYVSKRGGKGRYTIAPPPGAVRRSPAGACP